MLPTLTCASPAERGPVTRRRNPGSPPRREGSRLRDLSRPPGKVLPAPRSQGERQEAAEKREGDPPSPGSSPLRSPSRAPAESRRRRRGTVPRAGGKRPPLPRPRPSPSTPLTALLAGPFPPPFRGPGVERGESQGRRRRRGGRKAAAEAGAGCCGCGRGSPSLSQLASPPLRKEPRPWHHVSSARRAACDQPRARRRRHPLLLSSPLFPPGAAGCCKRRLAGARGFRPEKSRSRRFPLEAGFVFPGTALTRTEAAISARLSAGGQLQALGRGFSRWLWAPAENGPGSPLLPDDQSETSIREGSRKATAYRVAKWFHLLFYELFFPSFLGRNRQYFLK